jgi:hypothetical protein
MKKLSLLIVASFAILSSWATNYWWVGSTTTAAIGAVGTLATSLGGAGNGTLITLTTADVVTFDGSDISSTAGLQTGTVTFSQAAASYTIGQVILLNNATVIYNSTVTGRNLTIGAAVSIAGTDFSIAAGSSFTQTGSNITVSILTGNTAVVAGNYTCGGGANTHRFQSPDVSGITFASGSNFNPNASGGLFGNTVANSVLFQNGSNYNQGANGANPFQLTAPASVVVFQPSSNFNLIANVTPAFSGRTYGNFNCNIPTVAAAITISASGSGGCTFLGNLTCSNSGNTAFYTTFNLLITGGVSIGGNITVATSAASIFIGPSSANVLTLNGTSPQTISKNLTSPAATLTFNANTSVVINNPTTLSQAQTFSGGVTLNAAFTTTATATISNSTLRINTGGSISSAPTYSGATSTLSYNSGSIARGSEWGAGVAIGSGVPNNVTINLASGTDVLTLGANRTVPGVLTLTNGIIATGANVLTIGAAGASITGGSASSYVNGNLQRAVAAGSSTVALPIGSTGTYAPVSLAFGAGNTAGNVTASTTQPGGPATAGNPPTGSGLNQTAYINRSWALSSTISTPDYAATFTYADPADVAGGANTSALIIGKDDAGVWSNPGVATSISPSVATVSGLSSFGNFYLAEAAACSNNTFSGTGDWTDNARWSCGAPPSSGDVVIIAAGANATLNTNFLVGGSLTMNATSTLVVNPTITLSVGVSATANFNGQSVTFKSDATGTASLGQVNGTLSGATNVTVERFIPNNNFRSWRLLSVPTQSSRTIRQSWQEGDANPLPKDNLGQAGYGTQITGVFATQAAAAAAGFDSTSVQAGMLRWNGASWSNITSTNQPINNFSSYFLYIRGERGQTVTGSVNSSSATTLRTKGTVFTGDQTTNIGASAFALVPNLYPSAINFTGLTRTGGVNNLFYIWDSKKLNGNSLGVYQTFSNTNSFNCLISGGSYTLGQPNTVIESGQSFFVSSGAAGTIILKESAKVSGTNGSLGFRPSGIKRKLDTKLYNSSNEMLDANSVVFDAGYSKAVSEEDAPKLGNPGANFAVETDSKLLAITGTQPVQEGDAIQYRMWNLAQGTYTLEIAASNLNLPAGVNAILQDSYLGNSTAINETNTTSIQFTIDQNAGSSEANRFRIVFAKTKTVAADTKQGYSVAPNPVKNGVMNLAFQNREAGRYSIRLLSNNGKSVMVKTIIHAGGNAMQNVTLPSGVTGGTYTLEVIAPNKIRSTQTVLIAK